VYNIVGPFQQPNSIGWKLLSSVNSIGELGITSIIVLFVCLCWMSSSALQLLIEDVQKTVQETSYPRINVKRQLLKWKRSYRLVCQFTDDNINRCFGWILLFFFTEKFIGLICFTFKVYLSFSKGMLQTGGLLFDCITFYFQSAIYVCLLTAVCYRIREKVLFDMKIQAWVIF